jgi:acetyltransferase-like isoleucine patch superfamily enzyme
MPESPVQKIRDMPWLAGLELRRRLAWPLVRLQFAWHGIDWGRDWRIFGRPILQKHRGSRIALGDGLTLRSWPRSNPLAPTHPVVFSTRSAQAEIVIGDDCGFTGTTLVADASIRIGNRVLVGGNASIVDTDFHPLTPEGRRDDINAGTSRPIEIGDDVFIGMNSLILKGVTVGDGSVVGAGSVVSRDVPPHTIVAGNPATVVKELT